MPRVVQEVAGCTCIHETVRHDAKTGACLVVNPTYGPCPCDATSPAERDRQEAEWKKSRRKRCP